MKRRLPRSVGQQPLTGLLRDLDLVTVCEEARCPNRSECFAHGTATFMILGDTCTRKCGFCAVTKGIPKAPDPDEPKRLAEAVRRMGLRHAVITSVNRDDLKDGGSNHWAAVVRETRKLNPTTSIEVLTPDFLGHLDQVDTLLNAGPDVYNHNIETVPSHYLRVRPAARYERSLRLLAHVKHSSPKTLTKSGLMLGLGEMRAEVLQVLRDLRANKVDMITIGQYLQPAPGKLLIERFVSPQEFEDYRYEAMLMGFSSVASGPYIRSSYNASETFLDAVGGSGA